MSKRKPEDYYIIEDEGPEFLEKPKRKPKPKPRRRLPRWALATTILVAVFLAGGLVFLLFIPVGSNSYSTVMAVTEQLMPTVVPPVATVAPAVPRAANAPLATVIARRVTSAALSPDLRNLAVTYYDEGRNQLELRRLRVDGNLSSEVVSLQDTGAAVNRVAFSPDSSLLAGTSDTNTDDMLTLWNVVDGQMRAVIQGHLIAFCTACSRAVTATYDGTVYLWSLPDFAKVGELHTPDTGNVFSLAMTSDGRSIALGTWNNATSQTAVAVFDTQLGDTPRLYPMGDTGLVPVAFNPQGDHLAIGTGGTIVLLTLADGTMTTWANGNGRIFSLAFSPDGSDLAVAGGDSGAGVVGLVNVWDVQTRQIVGRLVGHEHDVYSVAYTGRYLLTASGDGSVRLWSAQSFEQLSNLRV